MDAMSVINVTIYDLLLNCYLTEGQTCHSQQWLEDDARLAQPSRSQARRHAQRVGLRTKVSTFGRAPSQLYCLSRRNAHGAEPPEHGTKEQINGSK